MGELCPTTENIMDNDDTQGPTPGRHDNSNCAPETPAAPNAQHPARDNTASTSAPTHLRMTPARSRAVRSIPKSSKGHFVGELVFNRGGQPQRLGFASKLECDAALCLIYRPGFADIEEQLAALPFTGVDGRPSNHFFDFRFTQVNGRRICISVKPEAIAETAIYCAMFEQVKRAAVGSICHAAITVTERNIHPVVLHNATLYHAARNPEPGTDAFVEERLREVTAPIRISEFLDAIGLGGKGFFSIARAIRFGHAQMFSPEKITATTLIIPKAA